MRKYLNAHKDWIIYISIAIVTLGLNVLAWSSTAFCDAYIAYIFPVWVNTYGRFTGLFPFSVGEWLIVAGVLLVLCAVLLLPVWGIVTFVIKFPSISKGIQKFYLFFGWVFLFVCLIMTLNCTILYHASTFSEKYTGFSEKEYSIEELLKVRNYVVQQCNELSQKMARDTEGRLVYTGSLLSSGEMADIEDKAIEVMQQLGKTYSQLEGYYPRPKPLLCSDFMCQQYMHGYYFPFSMEANYNDVMCVINKPVCMCHELAHLRGYIYEDEANFISYLACVQSDDIFFQYSGYLSVLVYLENDLYKIRQNNREAYDKAVESNSPLDILPQVYEDDVFVTEEEWERINKKALIDTETVDKAADIFIDTTLKINGVSDGKISYSRVVKLLLHYYQQDNMK